MKYKISVIVPVYNTEKYLRKCLNSLSEQSMKDIEIICVDDCSSDNSLSILKEFQGKHSNCILLCNKRNFGLSYSRNLAMKYARGEYIYFLDSDDYVDGDIFSICYNELKKHQLDIIFFELKVIYEEGMEEKIKFNYSRNATYAECYTGKEAFVLFSQNGDHKVNVPGAIFSKKFLEESGVSFYSGIIYEDNIFYLQTLFLAKRVKCLKRAFYNRVVRRDSLMTSRYEKKNLYSCVVVYAECMKFIMNHQNDIKCQKALQMYVNNYIRVFIPIYNYLKSIGDIDISFDSAYYMCMYDCLKKSCYLEKYTIKKKYRSKIATAKNVIVCGAGAWGSRTILALADIGISKFFIAVTRQDEHENYLLGNKVYNLCELDIKANCIVLVAVGIKYENEIVSYLEKNGYSNYILCKDYME